MTEAYERTKEWRARHSDIKTYRAKEARKWRAAHPEKWKEIKACHRAQHLEEIREQDRLSKALMRKNNPEKQRERIRRFKAKQAQKQQDLAGRPRPTHCELCGQFHKAIVYDHCHKCGHFRGWICDRCNKVLGLVYDDVTLLQKMVNYLGREIIIPESDQMEFIRDGKVIDSTKKTSTEI